MNIVALLGVVGGMVLMFLFEWRTVGKINSLEEIKTNIKSSWYPLFSWLSIIPLYLIRFAVDYEAIEDMTGLAIIVDKAWMFAAGFCGLMTWIGVLVILFRKPKKMNPI